MENEPNKTESTSEGDGSQLRELLGRISPTALQDAAKAANMFGCSLEQAAKSVKDLGEVTDMMVSTQISDNCAEWMEWLGGYAQTYNGDEVKGFHYDAEDASRYKSYLTSDDLRGIAAACIEMAEILDAARSTDNGNRSEATND